MHMKQSSLTRTPVRWFKIDPRVLPRATDSRITSRSLCASTYCEECHLPALTGKWLVALRYRACQGRLSRYCKTRQADCRTTPLCGCIFEPHALLLWWHFENLPPHKFLETTLPDDDGGVLVQYTRRHPYQRFIPRRHRAAQPRSGQSTPTHLWPVFHRH
jgi:hypothetical protein